MAAVLVLAPSRGEAMVSSWGYVCKTSLTIPSHSSYYGDHGYISVTLYSGPACTGTYKGLAFTFSRGATSSMANTGFLYDQPTLLYLAQGLRQAAIQRQRVYLSIFANRPQTIAMVIFSGWTQ